MELHKSCHVFFEILFPMLLHRCTGCSQKGPLPSKTASPPCRNLNTSSESSVCMQGPSILQSLSERHSHTPRKLLQTPRPLESFVNSFWSCTAMAGMAQGPGTGLASASLRRLQGIQSRPLSQHTARLLRGWYRREPGSLQYCKLQLCRGHKPGCSQTADDQTAFFLLALPPGLIKRWSWFGAGALATLARQKPLKSNLGGLRIGKVWHCQNSQPRLRWEACLICCSGPLIAANVCS